MAVLNIRVEGSTAPHRMLESIERLKALEIKMVYPGHGAPFKDFRGAVARCRKRIQGYLKDRSKIGIDLAKKILVYALLMKPGYPEASFLDYLMTTHWFPETVNFYFGGDCGAFYEQIMSQLLERKVIVKNRDRLFARVPS
jgi:glyoxylase-like metal-dependent hydrolase (beta-lactamase superfamily II)